MKPLLSIGPRNGPARQRRRAKCKAAREEKMSAEKVASEHKASDEEFAEEVQFVVLYSIFGNLSMERGVLSTPLIGAVLPP